MSGPDFQYARWKGGGIHHCDCAFRRQIPPNGRRANPPPRGRVVSLCGRSMQPLSRRNLAICWRCARPLSFDGSLRQRINPHVGLSVRPACYLMKGRFSTSVTPQRKRISAEHYHLTSPRSPFLPEAMSMRYRTAMIRGSSSSAISRSISNARSAASMSCCLRAI